MSTPNIEWITRQQRPDWGAPTTKQPIMQQSCTKQTLITNTITTQNPNKNAEKSDTLHANSITHYLTTTTVHPDVTQQQQQKKKPPTTTPTTKAAQTSQMNTEGTTAQEDRWGHPIAPKALGYIRFLTQNIGGIDLMPSRSIKLVALREFTTYALVDVVAIMECNAAWDNVEAQLHPAEQTRYLWECSQWSIRHNRQENYEETINQEGLG